uniref:Granulins domain-containing protein n=1 Tax=Meloidogyne enterolobii TaxID=390850 RepID=A0A6V7X461_MELEN|nr:unnamed protein product [Meloidogyne enterolobii]
MLLHRVILTIAALFILIISEMGVSQSEEIQGIRPVYRERGIGAGHAPHLDGIVCGIHIHGTDHCPKEKTCGYIDEGNGWTCSPSADGIFCTDTKSFCPKGYVCSKLNKNLCIPRGIIECNATVDCGSKNYNCRNGICIEQHISTLEQINLFKATNDQAKNSEKIKGKEAVDIQANHANSIKNDLHPNQASNIASNSLNGEEGVDLFELTSIDEFKCLKENLSVKFVIVRASRSNGYFDSNAVANIMNAWAAGINEVDIYIFPCVKPKLVENVICDNARGTIIQTLNKLENNNAKFGNVWLDIEELKDKSHWYKDKTKNLEFIEAFCFC